MAACPHGRSSITWCRPCEREFERTRSFVGTRPQLSRGFATAQADADQVPLVAAHAGRCATCGGHFAEGVLIRRGRWGWEHDDCPEGGD